MSISALRSARLFFGVMAVTVFSALLLVGCSKDDDDPPLPPPDNNNVKDTSNNNSGGGSSLVLGAGEAWIGVSLDISCSGGVCDTAEYEFGYIFQKNNDFLGLSNEDGQWYVRFTAKWSTSGNDLTFVDEDGEEISKWTYAISGNTFTLTYVEEDGTSSSDTFTKRSGINPVYPEP